MSVTLPEEIARDLRDGAIYEVEGERIGIRRVRRVWFNNASGHYVADVGACFLWASERTGPWHVVSNTSPTERSAA